MADFKLQIKGNGFTLFEVLLSMSIFAMLIGISIPIYQNLQVKNDLDMAINITVLSLRRAESLSQAVDSDTTWGLKISQGSLVLFKGAAYSLRDINFDEISDLPGTVTPSGVSEIVFSKFTGKPSTTGIISLTSTTNETKTVSINAKGAVDY